MYALPFRTAVRMGEQDYASRRGVLVKLSDGEAEGWGEAAPLAGWSAETPDEAASELLRLRRLLPSSAEDVLACASLSTVRFAIDTACRALAARRKGQSQLVALADILQPTVRVALLAGDRLEGDAGGGVPVGVQALKVKVGRQPWQLDVERIRALRAKLGEAVEFRLDANRQWSIRDAIAFFHEAKGLHIAFVEEPTPEPGDWGELVDTGIPLAIDESLHETAREADPEKPFFGARLHERFPHATVFVVKPALLGSWSATRRLFRDAAADRRVVVSGAYESGVATQANLALAAMNPRPVAAGLDPYTRLAEDLLDPPLPLSGGFVDAAQACDLRRRVRMERLTERK